MSTSNAVETKPEAPKADTAAALTAATPAPAVNQPGSWVSRNRNRVAMILGGGMLAAIGAGYGYKYINTTPAPAVAQGDSPVVAQAKDEQPKPAKPVEPPDLLDLKLPDVPPAPPVKIDVDRPVITAPSLPPTRSDTESPLILPPANKKPMEDDLFKAPGDLPKPEKRKPDFGPAPLDTDVKEPKKDTAVPIIRIGAELPPVPKPDEVLLPPPPPSTKKDDAVKLDLDLPPLPPAPGAKKDETKKDETKKDDIPIIAAPPIKSPMIPDVPKVPEKEIKAPEIGLPPVKIPGGDDPPPIIKRPAITDVPAPPPVPPITIDTPPPAPPKADKKDMYDEDWHTQREGDTYTLISKEYYKTSDYGAALEAYNKDRRQPGERIIRVPPIWVLEEQFPGMVNKNDKPAAPEIKPTGNVKFEPVAPLPSGTRPAPPPAATSTSDEYRVKNDAGETIREIARKVYGDDNAWKKLWELNPNLDPTRPIPSGTTLRLGK